MLTYLEDYLEFIAGYRTAQGRSNPYPMTTISLANYDRAMVDSIANQTMSGRGLTDRQRILIEKLVYKYRRQCGQQGVSIPDSFQLRIALRTVDRSQTVEHDVDNNRLLIKFRFENNLVDELREFRNISCGEVAFNKETSAWHVDISLPNIMWVWAWAKKHNFEIKFDINAVSQSLESNSQPYIIKTNSDGGIDVCPPSELLESYQPKQNLLQNIYHSSVWQIPYDSEVQKLFVQQYPEYWYDWTVNRQWHIKSNIYSLYQVRQWILACDPQYVIWQSTKSDTYEKLQQIFGLDNVSLLPDKARKLKPENITRIMFTDKLNTSTVKHLPRVQLLITDNSIMYGIKNLVQNHVDKLIYYGVDTLVEVKDR